MSTLMKTLLIALVVGAAMLAGCPAEDGTTPDTAEEAVADTAGTVDATAADAEEAAAGDGVAEGHPNSPFHAEGVEATVENTDNGVVMTLLTEDAEQAAQLQEHAAKKADGDAHEGHGDCACKWEGVTRTVENVEGGIKITLTTEDAELVTKVQESMAKKAAGEGCCGGKGHGDCPHAKEPGHGCEKAEGEECGCDKHEAPAEPEAA